MEQAVTPQDRVSTHAEQAADWLRSARGLAKRAGCEQAVAGSLTRLETLGRDTINAAIVGAPNSGKSSLINGLLERNLLPASPIPSHASFAIDGIPSGSAEKFVVANASRPIAQLGDALSSAQGSAIHVVVALDNEWLRSLSLRLMEKGPLDAGEKELPQTIDNCLRDSDIVVLLVDALMPMKRAEAELLRECARRGIPAIVMITKLAKLTEEERLSVLEYVEKHARQYVPDICIVDREAAALKDAIAEVIRGADFAAVRFEQFKYSLLAALEAIAGAARAGAEAESKSQAERDSDINQRKNQIDSQNLVWMQIEQQLNQRREKVEEQIRDHLAANQDKILGFLSYDLDKTSDVKTWWERDMPFRLRHELQGQAAGISASIDRQLASDRKWLQEELHRQFRYPLAIGLEPGFAISETDVAGRPLALADAQKLKIVTRVGTAAVVIAAGTLFATAGIGGAVLATSLLAGLGAEQWNHQQTSQNRELVRAELNTLVGRASVYFTSDVASKLKEWYDDVIASVREGQGQWQQAQLQALQTAKQKGDSAGRTDWPDILRQIDSLLRQIRPQIPA
jgi:GTP-binding protein EngB required for normal cell division